MKFLLKLECLQKLYFYFQCMEIAAILHTAFTLVHGFACANTVLLCIFLIKSDNYNAIAGLIPSFSHLLQIA